MKAIRKFYDPKTSKAYNVNVSTGIVCGTDGEYPTKEVEARILKTTKSRIRAQTSKQAMRDCGLVRVRGALGGIYWE